MKSITRRFGELTEEEPTTISLQFLVNIHLHEKKKKFNEAMKKARKQ